MQGQDEVNNVDDSLLLHFEQEIRSKVPHLGEKPGDAKTAATIINATPLVDITKDLKECAKNVFGLDLADKSLRVFGKFDSDLLAGSIKVRPAVQIIHDAIATGKLKRGQTIFEATSGNFGIALGQISKLGIDVVALVSRKLQEGVFDELRNENTRIINLDMDICPAPGMKGNASLMAAKATASNVRAQLTELGFDPAIFDKSRSEVEAILASQDIINLAKLLAKIYGGFCPEQYDNELNIEVHRTITAAELDQQLREQGVALSESRIVCTFGTGGTSGGLSRYMMEKYGKKSVHVVFPLGDQDVAGIRTKGKASGLKFYEPDRYAGQHEADFRQAKRLLKFFVDKGYDMGESSALALYAVVQMANFGMSDSFIVMIADGIQKYRKSLEAMKEEKQQRSLQVPLQEAVSNIGNYDRVVWIHTMYTPRKEGIELIAKSLGVDESKIFVPTAREVEQLLMTQQVPKEMEKSLGGANAKPLLVCMMGNTSLRVAEVLAQKGIVAESLNGGISALSEGKGKQLPELVRMATE
ncbi:cysteine synthase [Candidatus Nitrososphaera evergladensis SR1]|uniref:Cysteine synthase n=1 Tax=Candidatus Nitrososphaera evergladensis SR1 TaxID=1459636 RepID=A0A075MPI1_9ARCH|nr:pyridoxal-phosphate dependent enzyme [Candidatus Nitrososphaera evergladensis]AIF82707.1 cysteine synthase [Candidatus Nitrososphaera evergladensis SR1]